LGAPPALSSPPRLAPFIIAVAVVLGVLLPTLGLSLVAVLAIEALLRRYSPKASAWLGFPSAR